MSARPEECPAGGLLDGLPGEGCGDCGGSFTFISSFEAFSIIELTRNFATYCCCSSSSQDVSSKLVVVFPYELIVSSEITGEYSG